MPVFMKYQGVDGSMQGPSHHDLDILSYSIGSGSQAGADLRKGTWLADVTYDGAPAADGTSNTFLFAEKYPSQDGDLLIFDQYASQPISTETGFVGDVFDPAGGGEDSWGLWQI